MHIDGLTFLIWIVVLAINGRINIWAYKWYHKYQDKRFMKRLIIDIRGASTVTLETFGPNERETLRKLKEKLDETQRTAR